MDRGSSPKEPRDTGYGSDDESDSEIVTPVPGSPVTLRKPIFSHPLHSAGPLSDRRIPNYERKRTAKEKRKYKKPDTGMGLNKLLTENAPPMPSIPVFTLPPSRTIFDAFAEDHIIQYARAKTGEIAAAGPPKIMPGSRGVLRRIAVEVVPNRRHCTVWQ